MKVELMERPGTIGRNHVNWDLALGPPGLGVTGSCSFAVLPTHLELCGAEGMNRAEGDQVR